MREAGLETQRMYALDKKYVMIKVRCPKDRLEEVAEVLRLRLRTKGGWYEPFNEETKSQFLPSGDPCMDDPSSCLFRSSDRQTVINFIIQSRFRDSGAELGENTKLGKEIQMRVPLHMHATLESLFSAWVTYWHPINWQGRDGRSMSVVRGRANPNDEVRPTLSDSQSINISFSNTSIPIGSFDHEGSTKGKSSEDPTPGFITRFFVGAFHQPLDSIQQYYGEGVAFYFAWQQHLSYHLISLSIFGLVVFLCQIITGNWDHPTRPYFSVVVMIWSFLVMVNWKRRQTFLAHRWGTLNYQEEETTRPQFHGEYKFCPETNEWTIEYPHWRRWLKYSISIPLIIIFTLATLVGTLMAYSTRDILLNRYFDVGPGGELKLNITLSSIWENANVPINAEQLTTEKVRDPSFWLIILGFPSMIGLTLPLLNFLFMTFSKALNDFENHRTESEYRNQLIVKVFAFRFICYFVTLYYYSFLTTSKDRSAVATENSILRVASNLLSFITFSHWWYLLLTIFFPLLFHRWRLFVHRRNLTDEVRRIDRLDAESDTTNPVIRKKMQNARVLLAQAESEIWEEVMLPEYDSFREYMYMVVQFGFVTCFSVVLPLTPFICLLNHLLSMRLDAYKLCRARRRPPVEKAGGIGVWEHVLHTLTVFGVMTNCALMAFTSELFRNLEESLGGMLSLVIVCVGWEHAMLFIKYILQSATSSMPKSVAESLRRERHEKSQQLTRYVRAKKERRYRSSQLDGLTMSSSIDTDQSRDNPRKKSSTRKKTPSSTRNRKSRIAPRNINASPHQLNDTQERATVNRQLSDHSDQVLQTIHSVSTFDSSQSFDVPALVPEKDKSKSIKHETQLEPIMKSQIEDQKNEIQAEPEKIQPETKEIQAEPEKIQLEKKDMKVEKQDIQVAKKEMNDKNEPLTAKQMRSQKKKPAPIPKNQADVVRGVGTGQNARVEKSQAKNLKALARSPQKNPNRMNVVMRSTGPLRSATLGKQKTLVFERLSPDSQPSEIESKKQEAVFTVSPMAAIHSLRRRKKNKIATPPRPPSTTTEGFDPSKENRSPYESVSAPSFQTMEDDLKLPTPCKLEMDDDNRPYSSPVSQGTFGTKSRPQMYSRRPGTSPLRHSTPNRGALNMRSPMPTVSSVSELRKRFEKNE